MRLRLIAVGVLFSTLMSGTADAGLFRCGRCCRPTKCCAVEQLEPCKTYGAAAGAQGAYSAFVGADGAMYGVNTFTGQVYKLTDGVWKPHAPSMP
jgi:hypothetical protein